MPVLKRQVQMPGSSQTTLFAVDCGATNWRIQRVEYKTRDGQVHMLGEPQPASLSSFVDRRLPAVLCLNPEGIGLESFGETARQSLEDEQIRERVRDHFKPCIGSHLEKDPLPHQKRYTHAQAIQFTQMMLTRVLDQLRREKWRSQPFDDRVLFTFAYPVHWQVEHDGILLSEFKKSIRESFEDSFKNLRFVSEPEGAIISLQHRGLLEPHGDQSAALIVDVGGSTTDIIAGKVEPRTGRLEFTGRYGEPFGGGLYDAELAKHIAAELGIPIAAIADDPASLVMLRVHGQRFKESLSRQILNGSPASQALRRTVTLVTRDGTVFRRVVCMDEMEFERLTSSLDESFKKLVENALSSMNLDEREIGQVVLVGGGSRLFTIIRHLRQRFGEEKVVLADDPEEIVVQGLALEYGASFKKKEATIIFNPEISSPKPTEMNPESMPDPVWLLTGEDGAQIILHPGLNTIGRETKNDISIQEIKVSRFHAEIHLEKGQIRVTDLGSTNCTYVNGQALTPHEPRQLAFGDEIVFGNTRFIIKEQESNDRSET